MRGSVTIMSQSSSWKLYLMVAAIICLVVGFGIGWVARPPVEIIPAGYVSSAEYEEALQARAYPLPEMPYSNYTGKLRVYTWTGLGREDPMWWDEGPWGFSKIYPNVDIEWLYFEDEPHALSVLELDPDYADVIEVCGGQFKLHDYDLIEPIDPTMVPLISEFFPLWETFDAFYEGDELYTVPFEFGYTSLTYRIDMFEDMGISEALWNDTALLFSDIPALDGQIWMYDSVIEIMDLAASHVGYDLTVEDMIEWTSNETMFDEVKDALWGFKPKIDQFYIGVEEAYSALMAGECAAVIGWCDMYAVVKSGPDGEFGTADDLDVGFSFFSPMLSWGSGYTINKGLKERDPELYAVAHAFINAAVAREAQANKIMEWYTGAPNRYAYDIVEEEFPEFIPVIEEMRLDDPIFFAEESAYWIEPPTDTIDKWEEFWLEFQL
ncbi:MAG: extracellular solute-binding protein [Candidatus Bathyarchaeota archaeon]|nr:MAG: extracellular solute-binding protein [Candidatus Bathyarchaeota archaeon]